MTKRTTGLGPNPSGLCLCGCGHRAPIASRSLGRLGHVKGEPIQFIHGHENRSSPVEYVVDEATGCWLWQRAKNACGYGIMASDGRTSLAHRVYYSRLNGPIPVALEIDHLCRVRHCVNPAHMEPVDHAVNVQRGLLAALTPAQVADIKTRHMDGESCRALADEYGRSYNAVDAILAGRHWKNVSPTARRLG